jgi:hypothetical protein
LPALIGLVFALVVLALMGKYAPQPKSREPAADSREK